MIINMSYYLREMLTHVTLHMMLHTHPTTKGAVKVWIRAASKLSANARPLLEYSVRQPHRTQKAATNVPEI